MHDDPEIIARKPRRRTLVLFIIASMMAAGLALSVYWMYPTWQSNQSFDTAKIVTIHLDEEPFMRMALAPNQRYRPIELMAGTEAEALCAVVSRADSMRFTLRAFGQTLQTMDCNFRVRIPDEVGRAETFHFEFFDGDVTAPTDSLDVPVMTVAPGERMEFHALEDEYHQPVQAVSVPRKVLVYTRAIARLPNPKDFVSLYFVADQVAGVPVLQLAPLREGETEPKPLVGRLVRYRRYGADLDGYALWNEEPVIVGGEADHRRVYDIYVAVVRRGEVGTVFAKALSVKKTGEDLVTLTPLVQDIEALRKLTWEGKMLSPPIHVVRGGAVAEGGGRTIPVTE